MYGGLVLRYYEEIWMLSVKEEKFGFNFLN